MYDPNKKTTEDDDEEEYVAGDIYHGDDTSIWYDNDGDQHVEVGWDY